MLQILELEHELHAGQAEVGTVHLQQRGATHVRRDALRGGLDGGARQRFGDRGGHAGLLFAMQTQPP